VSGLRPGLLRTAQVCERYPISARTIDRLVREGSLRAYRIPGGNVRYFDPIEIEALWSPEDEDE
jgi:excisionase family DNA binding protein